MSQVKSTNDKFIGVYLGCMLLPKRVPGTLAMKIRMVNRVVEPVFKDATEQLAEFIKDNYKGRVMIPTGEVDEDQKPIKEEFKFKVDEEFIGFMHPFYQLPQPEVKLDELNQPVIEDGNYVYKEDSEEVKELKERRRVFIKVMTWIEQQKKYKDYREDIHKLEQTLNLPKFSINDFAGVELADRTVLDYFEPILKM